MKSHPSRGKGRPIFFCLICLVEQFLWAHDVVDLILAPEVNRLVQVLLFRFDFVDFVDFFFFLAFFFGFFLAFDFVDFRFGFVDFVDFLDFLDSPDATFLTSFMIFFIMEGSRVVDSCVLTLPVLPLIFLTSAAKWGLPR